MVYDLRCKLEKKFGNEFSDPTDIESRRKAEEDRARAFAKDDAKRATTMDQYFKKVTDLDANKAKAERLKKKREFLGFDLARRRWWTKRKVGPVEWYKNPAQFQMFTKVDLITLSRLPYVDDQPGGRGYLFFERLQREVARGFPSMHTTESIVTPAAKDVRDPCTNKRMKIVSWPPTDKEKTIPLVKKILKGKAVIVCDGDVSFRLIDQVDLLNLAQENLEVLVCNQIRVTKKYEEEAKGWTAAVASVIHIRTNGFGGFKDWLGGSGGN
ncbi:hypothetical protein Hanom_Chr02g00132351 [Helianthus anomalus]